MSPSGYVCFEEEETMLIAKGTDSSGRPFRFSFRGEVRNSGDPVQLNRVFPLWVTLLGDNLAVIVYGFSLQQGELMAMFSGAGSAEMAEAITKALIKSAASNDD